MGIVLEAIDKQHKQIIDEWKNLALISSFEQIINKVMKMVADPAMVSASAVGHQNTLIVNVHLNPGEMINKGATLKIIKYLGKCLNLTSTKKASHCRGDVFTFENELSKLEVTFYEPII